MRTDGKHDQEETDDVKLEKDNQKPSTGIDLLYGLDDIPPWYLCIILGFQHFLTMLGSTMSIPLLLAGRLCITEDVVKAELIGTLFFVSGLITVCQSTFGTRLPIVQGGSFAFLAPTFAILALPDFVCTPGEATVMMTNISNMSMSNTTAHQDDDWKFRMNEIQGAIIGASLLEVLIGATGIIGILLHYIGPLAIAPTITLVGISLFEAAANNCAGNWWVAIMTIVLITLFSQYLRNIELPCCMYSGKAECSRVGFPLFKLFPVILGISISWLICYILTVTDAIPDDPDHWAVAARTDTRIAVLSNAKWFRFPYPCQWGLPTFSAAGVFGMLAGVIAGIIESVGDYYACARLAGAPPPPVHAINRGIIIEGIGCVLAGLWGTGNGTTSYSQNIGAIGITKVGSRRVIQWCGLMLMIFGVVSKFGALFVTLPAPILGGLFMIMFGMISSVGISNLQFVDLNSSRNLFIFGFSMFFGLSLPQWMKSNPLIIQTGNEIVDQIITVLLSTSMFVGGLLGFVLDNTIPGTEEERGLMHWRALTDGGSTHQKKDALKGYDLPWCTACLNNMSWTKLIPFCPSFDPWNCCNKTDAVGQDAEVTYDGHMEAVVVNSYDNAAYQRKPEDSQDEPIVL